jgi:hypothetical protein
MSLASAIVLGMIDDLEREIRSLEERLAPIEASFDPPIRYNEATFKQDPAPSKREHPSLRLDRRFPSLETHGWKYWPETDDLHRLIEKMRRCYQEMNRNRGEPGVEF